MRRRTIGASTLVVGIGLLAWWLLGSDAPSEGPPSSSNGSVRGDASALASRAAGEVVPVDRSTASLRSAASEGVAVSETEADWFVLEGRVVDAANGRPLSATRVEVFEAVRRSWRREDIVASRAAYLDGHGQVAFAPAPWPALVATSRVASGTVDPAIEIGSIETPVIEAPDGSREPADSMETDESGHFELLVPPRGGVLRCSRDGYTALVRPVRDRAPVTLAIDLARTLVGRVVDETGHGVAGLELTFVSPRGHGSWSTTTRADGTFVVEVDEPRVVPTCRSRGWTFRSPTPLVSVDRDASLVALRVPLARVSDADTGEPIEQVALQVTSASGQLLLAAGAFHSDDGTYPLLDYRVEGNRCAGRVAIWAEGYAAKVVDVPDLEIDEPIAIELHPSAEPTVLGTVTRNGVGIAAVRIALRHPSPRVNGAWSVGDLPLYSVTETDDAGRFALAPPPGRYVLQLFGDGVDRVTEVVAPVPESLDLELDGAGTITVRVIDREGDSIADEPVVVQGESGRRRSGRTNGTGAVRFEDLAPGRVTVAVARVVAGSSLWATPARRTFDLTEGDVLEVTLESSRPSERDLPVHLRLDVRGIPGPQGWSVLDDATGLWLTLGDDGTVPVDVRDGAILTLRDPTGRQHRELVPPDPSPDAVVSIEVDLEAEAAARTGYRFILVDAETGGALRGLAVEAIPIGGGETAQGVTDDRGEVVLAGLESVRHSLHFSTPDRRGLHFEPDFQADTLGAPLLLSVPQRSEAGFTQWPATVVRGRVLGHDDEPVVGATVQVAGVAHHTAGRWFVSSDDTARTNPDGSFDMIVASTPSYEATIALDPHDRATWHRVRWEAGAAGEERVIRLDDDRLSSREGR